MRGSGGERRKQLKKKTEKKDIREKEKRKRRKKRRENQGEGPKKRKRINQRRKDSIGSGKKDVLSTKKMTSKQEALGVRIALPPSSALRCYRSTPLTSRCATIRCTTGALCCASKTTPLSTPIRYAMLRHDEKRALDTSKGGSRRREKIIKSCG